MRRQRGLTRHDAEPRPATPSTVATVAPKAPREESRGKLAETVPRWAVIGTFLLLSVAGVAYARVFLMPVVMAFLLALVFSPIERFLRRHRLPSTMSAVLIVGALVTGLVCGALLLTEPVSAWIDDAPQLGRELERKVRGLMGSAQAVVEAGNKVTEVASGGKSEDVQEVVVREPGLLSSFAYQAPALVGQIAFTLVLLLLLLSSGDMFYEKLVHAMPTFKDKLRAIRIAYDVERKLSRYLFTITLINAGLGCAIGGSMWLLGMPNPLLFGVIAFAFNYVPYLGAAAGLLIAAGVGLVTFDHVGYALLPAAAYLALTSIEGNFVTPYFVGRRLEMNTVVIFLSIAFWAWLWSIVGMLVAVPLLVVVRVFSEHIPQLQEFGNFLSVQGDENGDDEDERAPARPDAHSREGA